MPAALGIRVTRDTVIYISGAVITLFLALANVAVITRFLDPAEFGELALLLTFAAFLTVLYNLGTLQGTFMWVFGASGEEEVEEDTTEAATGSKRRALGTGLVMVVLIAGLGTVLVAALAPWLSDLVLGDSSQADLILIAGASGASGAVWRLVANILRMERRPRDYVVLNAVRPVLVLGVAIPLVASGGGIEGAIAGTAIGGWLSVAVGLVVTRHNFVLALDRTDVGEIFRRGALFIPVIISFWIAQNVDLFALSKFAPEAEVGLYRLAGRFGAFVSYFSSALFMAWTPLVRTPTFAAAEEQSGRNLLGGTFLTYFVLGGALLVLTLTVGADLLVQIAPPAYAGAAPLIPIVAAGFLAHGLMVAIYRVSKFKRKRAIYAASALLSAAVFIAAALLLIPWLGAYGAALAVIVGFLAGTAVLAAFSQRGRDPLEVEYGRILRGVALGGACLLVAKGLGALAGPWSLVVELAALALYPILLAVSLVVPREEMKEIGNVVRAAVSSRHRDLNVKSRLRARSPADVAALQSAVAVDWRTSVLAEQSNRDPSTVGADLVRLLRLLDGSEPTDHDGRIGAYLFAEGPVAERDAIGRNLWSKDVDPADVHRLEGILVQLGRVPQQVWDECTASLAPTKTLPHRRDRRIWPRRRHR